jgi:hypothetical protein
MFSAAPVLQSVVLDANNNLADTVTAWSVPFFEPFMVDVLLMQALMKAVPDRAALLIVGRHRPGSLGRSRLARSRDQPLRGLVTGELIIRNRRHAGLSRTAAGITTLWILVAHRESGA